MSDQIADLLAQSRQAHQEYRENIPRMVPGGGGVRRHDGDASVASEALLRACRLRTEAHVLDPAQASPAWRDEPVTHNHDELLAFYVDMLSRPA